MITHLIKPEAQFLEHVALELHQLYLPLVVPAPSELERGTAAVFR